MNTIPGKKLISGCSAGLPLSHDGKDRLVPGVRALLDSGTGIAACPEQLGGLPVPREICEIEDGDGFDVLDGTARVVTRSGVDVTSEFLRGARRMLEIARQHGCRKAVLKARSPSCGRGTIYDGSFSGRLKPGHGVAAALLLREGIEVLTDEDFQ
ncbi:MAG: DUF523 domain-containing protein [Thermoleophilia bacterium]|nr:DUF523 domain-containing protein [Thermoleophilia bacterium]